MILCGIDPGLDGALAFLDTDSTRVIAMIGMPALKLGKGKGTKREISARILVVEIEREITFPVGHVYLERVASSPQMGVTSAFAFGRGYGTVEGVIAALGWPMEYVTPSKWKGAMNVPAEKDDARNRASQLLPMDAELWTPKRLVFNSEQAGGRAEAALIALYGARELARVAGAPLLARAG